MGRAKPVSIHALPLLHCLKTGIIGKGARPPPSHAYSSIENGIGKAFGNMNRVGTELMDQSGLPSAERLRRSAFEALSRYLGPNAKMSHELFGPDRSRGFTPSYQLSRVPLPAWAAEIGIGNPPSILVDSACLVYPDDPNPSECDWLLAAGLHLEGWLERAVEAAHGPLHSYSLRLPKTVTAAYDHAWVNRIGLYIRRTIANATGQSETAACGEKPKARIILTHDVDALEKTLQLRIKSSIMSGIAICRHLSRLRFKDARNRLVNALRYALAPSDYRMFEQIMALEDHYGVKSVFLFSDYQAAGLKSWLIDPSYCITQNELVDIVRAILARGWQVGMHPGFQSWNSTAMLTAVRLAVGSAAGEAIDINRQHWLRFSWDETWRAQHEAGIRLDLTLGFNDRPGFRNGSALRYRPLSINNAGDHHFNIVPTVFMDSHFYDYAFPTDVAGAMQPWIDEVAAVGGEASIIWHSQTMHPEYGWADGYVALLTLLAVRGITQTLIEREDLVG